MDECQKRPGICMHGRCINEVGSFSCECQDGYQLNEDLLLCEGFAFKKCFYQHLQLTPSLKSKLLTTEKIRNLLMLQILTNVTMRNRARMELA